MNKNKIPIIVIVGPTASGKTALSIKIAKKFNAEIVSADSMQVYSGMDIATAKPNSDEMQGIKHHLIDCVDISRKFSVAEYLDLARQAIFDINKRGKTVVLVGGTGLYVNSLVDNVIFEPEEQNELRYKLTNEFKKYGGEYMLFKLSRLDPEYAQTLHSNDSGRIIRGIEINTLFNHTVKEHKILSKSQPSPYSALMLGITYNDRQKLYDRINLRVDKMLSIGLVDEAKNFFNKLDSEKTAVQAIGYKELFPYLNGKITLDEATENLKKATRNYAKRQLTWFKKDQRIHWMNADELTEKELENAAFSLCREFLYNSQVGWFLKWIMIK